MVILKATESCPLSNVGLSVRSEFDEKGLLSKDY